MNRLNRRKLLQSALGAGASLTVPVALAEQTKTIEPEIHADVCILGAGASGMFAATKLRERGYKVVVLEKDARVGGHAHTHHDKATGRHTELGVRLLPDIPIITDTFAKFGVALKNVKLADRKRAYVDIGTGVESEYKTPNPLELGYALIKYNVIYDTRFKYLGEPGIELPNEIPEELLMNFGEFLEKNNLDIGCAPVAHYLQGYGHARNVPTLYALKNLRKVTIETIMRDACWTPELGMGEIYRVMAEQLGDDVILEAAISSIKRDPNAPVKISFKTPGGSSTVTADKLIVAFPPKLDRMGAFDLNETENNLFSKFETNFYWSALVRTENLVTETFLLNTKGDNVLQGQTFPGMYTTAPTGIPGVVNVLYGSTYYLSDDEVKARITTDIELLKGSYANGPVKVLGFENFVNHIPYGIDVSVEEIKSGFYRKFNGLQGRRNTYFTGAATDTNDHSSVWAHADKLVDDYFPTKV